MQIRRIRYLWRYLRQKYNRETAK